MLLYWRDRHRGKIEGSSLLHTLPPRSKSLTELVVLTHPKISSAASQRKPTSGRRNSASPTTKTDPIRSDPIRSRKGICTSTSSRSSSPPNLLTLTQLTHALPLSPHEKSAAKPPEAHFLIYLITTPRVPARFALRPHKIFAKTNDTSFTFTTKANITTTPSSNHSKPTRIRQTNSEHSDTATNRVSKQRPKSPTCVPLHISYRYESRHAITTGLFSGGGLINRAVHDSNTCLRLPAQISSPVHLRPGLLR